MGDMDTSDTSDTSGTSDTSDTSDTSGTSDTPELELVPNDTHPGTDEYEQQVGVPIRNHLYVEQLIGSSVGTMDVTHEIEGPMQLSVMAVTFTAYSFDTRQMVSVPLVLTMANAYELADQIINALEHNVKDEPDEPDEPDVDPSA